jgi:hypothetical protein
MIAAPVQHGHWDLAVLREAPPVTASPEPVGREWRLDRGRLVCVLAARRTEQTQRATHLRLDVLER